MSGNKTQMMSAKKNKSNVGVILLAAGDSSRLGAPKQLLLHDGKTLLQNSIQAANASNGHPSVIVLGANADAIKKECYGLDTSIVVNAHWHEGMASSIRCGIKTLVEVSPSAEGAILMVCDQPYVSASLLNNLIDVFQNSSHPIVTCSYAGIFGPPALFPKRIFPELLQLKGDVGAKNILNKHSKEVEVILFPEGNLDIDTIEDYKKLSKGNPR